MGRGGVFVSPSGKSEVSTEMLQVSLLGVGTVLRLGRDALPMVKRLWQAT